MLTAASLLQLRAESNLRPPAWRWQLAAHVRDQASRRQATPAVDAYADVARGIQDDLGAADTEAGRAYAVGRYGAAADAYAFWVAGTAAAASEPGDGTDGPMYGPLSEKALALAEFEGLVLAGRPAEKIARHTGLSVDSVRWYELLWFDVRDRLRNPGWVAANVIGSLHQGSVATLLPALVRAYGYYSKSARMVTAAASGFDAKAARGATRSRPDRFFAADAISAGGLKAALAVRLTPLTDRRVYGKMIELHQEALRIDAETAPTGNEAEQKYVEVFGKLAAKVHYTFGDPARRLAAPAGGLRLAGPAPDDDEATG